MSELLENRRTEVGDHNADDANKRFKAHLYGTSFGHTKVEKLNAMRVERWRDTLLANTTFEMCRRTHKTFNAAMNYGFRRGAIASDAAWKRVPLVSGDASENALDFYWTVEERRAFFDKPTPCATCSPQSRSPQRDHGNSGSKSK